jgi:outer membrane lipoprotein SlyB
MMPTWLARVAPIAALALAGCAGQGQFSDGGMGAPFQPAPPPPVPAPAVPAPAPMFAPAPPPAQTYIYPDKGQPPQQQESDKGQCYMWAVQQTGFDPANPRVAAAPPLPQQYGVPQAPQGGLFRGAMGGAALGAVGGAIGGNAGEGAAIGAGVGALFGGMRRMRWAEEQQQQQQQMRMQQQSFMTQQQNAMAQGRANYERAFSACMSARGYTVR